ncbi:MAG TPA: 30S ribosomal protein S9 [Bacteroidales bacterium]|jgi:small subunit ribosomal protein S9|nr:30S ribosomal protein S9 [Bacteroidales bacterium]HNX06880.1 30S ribosomal protein S9 [Bacteroidales bacterium]HNZ43313.1 30S ribosomal protein S9 [Bacteroidales bacterium]HOH84079.1 30S ribosomal protein S9 [Bacteroidales bacterium]HOV10299.1 30S ribosomal protein S9 [Bacteroidales bacterium]
MEVIHTIGRRKTAVARIYVKEGKGEIVVNSKDFKEYFPTPTLQYVVKQPLELTNSSEKYDIKANIDGGGFNGQAEALSLAISRALCEIDAEHRPVLKPKMLLRRDPRMVERKKPGQKKARKRFQFSKR